MYRGKTTLLEKNSIVGDVFELKYSVPEDFSYEPGQFVNIRVTPPYHRPYSILGLEDNVITLAINVSKPGKGSDYFRNTAVGDETELMGPLGRFIMKDTVLPKVFIAAGVGIAPFIPMIHQVMNGKDGVRRRATLYFGMRYMRNDVLVSKYLSDYIEDGSLEYTRCVTEPEHDELVYYHGRVTKLLHEKFHHDVSQTEFYVCGSNDMVKEVKQILIDKGCEKVFIENYG